MADDGDKKVCFYCLDTMLSVCVCLACRSKLERARDELARMKKDQEIRKALYWKGVREKQRAPEKKNKGKR